VEPLRQTWLVVHPESMLWALEEVAAGRTPEDVMYEILDFAQGSMEEESDDG